MNWLDKQDALVMTGLALVGLGVGLIYFPAALILMGALSFFFGVRS